ncbi:Beta-glucosidase 12 [Ananas comosus]|uniref:Beta-glucosidase 12 n=1 Tax=Ananas comosus TaxID=4615 RepID=A0A199VUC1_ANACO|nr:Beta-glucosidase 12 [Ananas comosus]
MKAKINKLQDDIKLMKQMGTNAFRFSISWPRILPNGSLSGGVNKQGVEFYNNLIDELISNGLQPFITIFHWDLPQAVEDEYGGFLSDRIFDRFNLFSRRPVSKTNIASLNLFLQLSCRKDYVDFAEVCFREFGDRVKHWITFNEPWTFCSVGYDLGKLAPARCTPQEGRQCLGGNSATEPYTVCHHTLVAHGEAVHLYKQKYQVYYQNHCYIPSSNFTLPGHNHICLFIYLQYAPSKIFRQTRKAKSV